MTSNRESYTQNPPTINNVAPLAQPLLNINTHTSKDQKLHSHQAASRVLPSLSSPSTQPRAKKEISAHAAKKDVDTSRAYTLGLRKSFTRPRYNGSSACLIVDLREQTDSSFVVSQDGARETERERSGAAAATR